MIRYIFEPVKNFLCSRMFLMLLMIGALYGCIIVRLFHLQILDSEEYADAYLEQTEKEIVTAGTRGLIYDRNGNLLAGNELSYAVTISDDVESGSSRSETLNAIIHTLIHILKENGDTVKNSLSIGYEEGEFVYKTTSETARLRFLKDIYGVTDLVTEEGEDYSLKTAQDCYLYLKDKYDVDDSYSIEDTLDIIYIRIQLTAIYYQKYKSITVASGISEESVASIYEHEAELTGVTVTIQTNRIYYNGMYFSHILGYTGLISDSQLESFLDEGLDYNNADIVGKAGIESSMEQELQGTKGYTTVSVNNTGKVLEVLSTTEAEAGSDIYLTIDRDLQIACYHLLEQELSGILVSKIVNCEPTEIEDSSSQISAKQVYFQLINNNVVDITRLDREDASENEKNILAVYKTHEKEALDFLEVVFRMDNTTALNSYSDEYQRYIMSCLERLADSSSWGILTASDIPSSDATYAAWSEGTISPSEWILYCISQNAVSLTNLGIEEEYVETEVIFEAIVAYIFEHIDDNTDFSKVVYEQLIYQGYITGGQVCLLLFNQGILEEDTSVMNRLATGSSAASYDFIIEKISSLEITPGELALDPCSGSVVVTDPDTGEVLACVSYPSYDNNYLSGTINPEYWSKLLADSSSPLYNRATQTRTAPGSTFKMVTATAGLEEGIITPDTYIRDKGIFTLISPSPKCWIYPGNHGSINCANALKASCNYFFYSVGYSLGNAGSTFSDEAGLATLEKYAAMYGLTSKSGVEIDENQPIFSTESIVRSAIGQGSHSFTNVQLARYVSTIANGGNNYELTLIGKVQDSEGNDVYENEGTLTGILNLQESTLDTITEGMRLVISSGSVKSVFSDLEKAGVKAAGKSGTAQENLTRSNHSLFVSMAPYDDPEVVVTVVIPFGGSSSYAAEVNSKVLKYYYGLITLEEILEGSFTDITDSLSND